MRFDIHNFFIKIENKPVVATSFLSNHFSAVILLLFYNHSQIVLFSICSVRLALNGKEAVGVVLDPDNRKKERKVSVCVFIY